MDLTKMSKKDLQQIIRNYNLHYHIPAWSKLSKVDLIHKINMFMEFINGKLQTKKPDVEITIPKQKPKQPKVKQPKVKVKQPKVKAKTEDDEMDDILNEFDSMYKNNEIDFVSKTKQKPKQPKVKAKQPKVKAKVKAKNEDDEMDDMLNEFDLMYKNNEINYKK